MPDFRPGPWELKYFDLGWLLIDAEGEIIETIYKNSPRDEANAHLIAAAPEMYEALIGCLHYIEHSMTAKDKVRAALAKADGKE